MSLYDNYQYANQGGGAYNQGDANTYNPNIHYQQAAGYPNAQQQQQGGQQQHIPSNFNVSPEMLNFGLRTGQDIISKQRDKWMPGVSGFWVSLKYYFSVSNSYVVTKMKTVLYPLGNKYWTRTLADEYQNDGQTDQLSSKWALPKQDTNSPDLYIPLMSFVTYVLLCGLNTGIKGYGGQVFTPEVLVQTVWRCLLLQLAESVIIKLGVGVLSVSLPFLEVFSYTGYKYVGLCIGVISQLFGSTISTLASIYTTSMLAYFILKTLAAAVPVSTNTTGGPPRHLLLLAFAAMQFVVTFTLSMI